MSGHSKWAQIKRQKGAADVKKGALYTKLGHAIVLAVREGGKDAAMNVRLRLALEKAKEANMPSATIERALKRGAGESASGAPPERVVYEGFGPAGAALLIEAVTDNKNRTINEVRHVLAAHGGSLGASGSVQWLFEQHGVITLGKSGVTEAEELQLIDAGADDIQNTDDGVMVLTAPDALDAVKTKIAALSMPVASAELSLLPKTDGPTLDAGSAAQLTRLLHELEALDDVSQVTTNAA